jgi:hypothetical protein
MQLGLHMRKQVRHRKQQELNRKGLGRYKKEQGHCRKERELEHCKMVQQQVLSRKMIQGRRMMQPEGLHIQNLYLLWNRQVW